MRFMVDIPDEIVRALEQVVDHQRVSRSAVMQKALMLYMVAQAKVHNGHSLAITLNGKIITELDISYI